MTLETTLLELLQGKPASGGRLIERLQAARSELVAGCAVVVYGALQNLRDRGEVSVLATGPGERLLGVKDAVAPPLAAPGFPPSFSLGAAELGLIDREIGGMTDGLPLHYFEELRRVVVADADRRVFDGAKLPGAVVSALADLGPGGSSVRRYLKQIERGKPAKLGSTSSRSGLRKSLVTFVVLVFLFWLLFGFYTVPAESISMAPALIPAREGGDRLVVAGLYSAWLERPARGEIWVFDLGGEMLVKRIMGLPGETISLEKGDLFVNGKRLVKERALLDRMKVPLFDLDGFVPTDSPTGVRQLRPAHAGFLLPDGRTERSGNLICRDVVIRARVRVHAPASVTFVLESSSEPAHTLVLSTFGKGGAAVAGVEVAKGEEFSLAKDQEVEVWLTNADRVFRVEIDGREVARAPILRDEAAPRLSIVTDGDVDLREVEIARDVIHASAPGAGAARALEEGECFALGDNTAQSRDSRQLGPIPLEDLRGRLLAVLWPPSRIRGVE